MTTATVLQDLRSIDAVYQGGTNKLHGRINGTSGRSVAGLRVFAMQGGQPVATAVTGMDGKFTFAGLNAGIYKIWVDKMGIDNSVAPSVNFPSYTYIQVVCSLTNTQLRIVSQSTGLNTTDQEETINVYPNPTNGSLSIYLPGAGSADMYIYDITGQEMIRKTLIPGNQLIDMSDLCNGIYQVRIQSPSGVETKKLILRK